MRHTPPFSADESVTFSAEYHILSFDFPNSRTKPVLLFDSILWSGPWVLENVPKNTLAIYNAVSIVTILWKRTFLEGLSTNVYIESSLSFSGKLIWGSIKKSLLWLNNYPLLQTRSALLIGVFILLSLNASPNAAIFFRAVWFNKSCVDGT